jgi:Resolvase, N terminal domain
MTKITAEHLDRGAFVYIGQSTADHLSHNVESRRRQYGLADRARQLGWRSVEVIDDDLGRSGGGVKRPGFERLLAAICEGRVGAVLTIEASWLAHTRTSPQAIVNLFPGWYRDLGYSGCSSHSGRRTFITNAARKISKIVSLEVV